MNSSHGLSEKTVATIRGVFVQHPELEQAVLFGSRAKGDFKSGSDIDLALTGSGLTQKTVDRIYDELDDLPIPYGFSFFLTNDITEPEIIAQIDKVGVVFYKKAPGR